MLDQMVNLLFSFFEEKRNLRKEKLHGINHCSNSEEEVLAIETI